MEFRQVVIGIRLKFDILFEIAFPFPEFAEDPALGKVGVHDGVHRQGKIAVLMGNKVGEVLFDFIFQNQG